MGEPLLHESLTKSIIGAFFEVYNELDFGFLEHMCVSALEIELAKRGHSVAREVGIRVWYKGQDIGAQRLDMIVDDASVSYATADKLLASNQHRSWAVASLWREGELLPPRIVKQKQKKYPAFVRH
jgi:GxxExxY protein